MKIAIVEDNIHKRKKIRSFLDTNDKEFIFGEAASYSSGVEMLEKEKFDFLILDMSLPTYDIENKDGGGNLRNFGGKDILKRLKRKKKLLPFVIVTQYTTFSESTRIQTLEELKKEISQLFSEYFKKIIFYDTTSIVWKDELAEVIKEYD